MKKVLIVLALLFQNGCEKVETIENSSSYIFAWTKDENGWDSEFLTVINANPKDKDYGSLIKTLPVGYKNINAHHSEHRFHNSKHLFNFNPQYNIFLFRRLKMKFSSKKIVNK